MSDAFKDHFSGYAPEYREFRPTYPPELFAYLASVSPARELAWDCGTGSGQAAVPLAAHFARVFATDASPEQVQNAERHPRVEYAVTRAEACPLPDASTDLITVAQALHWFNFDRFYPEVRRVAKPGGIFAAWAYNFHSVTPEVDAVLARLQREFIGPHWPPGREHVDAGYRTVPFPFAELDAPVFEMSADWTLDALLGYVNTWSAVKRFAQARGFNPVERLRTEFAGAWDDRAIVRRARWALAVRLGRVNVA
jgi:SAM-dependent methyltransferase